MTPKPVAARVPDHDEEERLSLHPFSFEEALQALLAVDPADIDSEKGEPDGDC